MQNSNLDKHPAPIKVKNRRCCCDWWYEENPIHRFYGYLMLAQVILYAEAGAVPAMLVIMNYSFNLTFQEQGFLGGSVYLGIGIGAPVTSWLFYCFKPKTVLVGSIACNAIFVFLFALTPHEFGTHLLIICRFFIGFTQATLATYCPVWVDRFAAREDSAKWFSWLQVTIPLGIMAGYVLGWMAVILQAKSDEVGRHDGACLGGFLACWRLPFIVQSVVTIPICYAFWSFDWTLLKISKEKTACMTDLTDIENEEWWHSNEEQHLRTASLNLPERLGAHFGDVWSVFSQFYFTVVGFVLCGMYFIMMAIQFWATEYMIQGRGFNEHEVMMWFIITSATAPVLGALAGGYIIDKIGGYRGDVHQRAKCVGVIFMFQVISTAFSVPATYWHGGGLTWVVLCLWVVLFFGGMAVPALTGMYTEAIPQNLKMLGSSIMLVKISILAYFLSPIFSGYLMSTYSGLPECEGKTAGSCEVALERGFRASLFVSFVVVLLTMVLWVGGCYVKIPADSKHELGNDEEQQGLVVEYGEPEG